MTPDRVVFSGAGGGLLDRETGSYEPARPAIAALARLGVPLVLCSSRTPRDHAALATARAGRARDRRERGGPDRADGHLRGGVPGGEWDGGFQVLRLGPRAGDPPGGAPPEVARSGRPRRGPGFPPVPRGREHSEPFLVESEEDAAALAREAAARGLRVARGESLYHLCGGADKGLAVRTLLSLYQREGRLPTAIALGAWQVDLPMLRAVHRPVVCPGPAEEWSQLLAAELKHAERARRGGPEGWNDAVLTVLAGRSSAHRLPGGPAQRRLPARCLNEADEQRKVRAMVDSRVRSRAGIRATILAGLALAACGKAPSPERELRVAVPYDLSSFDPHAQEHGRGLRGALRRLRAPRHPRSLDAPRPGARRLLGDAGPPDLGLPPPARGALPRRLAAVRGGRGRLAAAAPHRRAPGDAVLPERRGRGHGPRTRHRGRAHPPAQRAAGEPSPLRPRRPEGLDVRVAGEAGQRHGAVRGRRVAAVVADPAAQPAVLGRGRRCPARPHRLRDHRPPTRSRRATRLRTTSSSGRGGPRRRRAGAVATGSWSEENIFLRHLAFDVARERTPFCPGIPNPFRKPEVREAVSLALDRERLAAAAGAGARPAYQLVPRAVFGHDPGLPPVVPDPARARALLAQAGFPRGFDVVLHRPRGYSTAAEMVKEQLAAVGIRVRVESLPSAEFFDALDARKLSFWIVASGCPTGDGIELLETSFHSPGPGGLGVDNYGDYRRPGPRPEDPRGGRPLRPADAPGGGAGPPRAGARGPGLDPALPRPRRAAAREGPRSTSRGPTATCGWPTSDPPPRPRADQGPAGAFVKRTTLKLSGMCES